MFTLINRDNCDRKEIFDHYLNQATSFSLTKELDVSHLLPFIRENRFKLYPTFIYLVTKIVNLNHAFKTSFNSEGELGYWDYLDPMYTIFNEKDKLFKGIWTHMTPNFDDFHHAYLADVKKYKEYGGLFPKKPIPQNTVSISMIPWTSFSGFNLNIGNNPNHLLPIITAGKFVVKGNRIVLPVSLQVHHAVCDGYHASIFMEQFNEFVKAPDISLK
ncbi:type A chloramphenicol O-acetyltransferase [Alkalicoccobacillus gibsonii]|uniref:type A chloramphenicol O-acetyltransferase n=1 Tax=Alkalicoccobacillus gibsonii TaxID=79881 RepID=UPI001934942C|nr:type A chloramphenicol O-acetyltransferase [Alkalicoccobacillus gibsonii]MBM0066819.1 type A chloramphenicol O-acetyltransferase [Alkalicoccobacillus gibsonii]